MRRAAAAASSSERATSSAGTLRPKRLASSLPSCSPREQRAPPRGLSGTATSRLWSALSYRMKSAR